LPTDSVPLPIADPTKEEDDKSSATIISPHSALHDSVGFTRVAITRWSRKHGTRTMYAELTEHPTHPTDVVYGMATERIAFRSGVRWWGVNGKPIPGAGVPLVAPEGRESSVYFLAGDDWVEDEREMSTEEIERCFPVHMPKQFR